MNKLTINYAFKSGILKDFLAPDKYDFYIVFSRDYTRDLPAAVSPRDTLNSIFNDSTPGIKLVYIKKITDAEIFGAIRKDRGLVPENNYSGIPSTTYLTFQSDSLLTLEVYDNTKHWDGILYYSTDLETWHEWNGTTISSVNNKLYLRGTGNTIITGSSDNYRWVLTGSNIKCIGNIENLLDWETVESGNHPTMANNCYYAMFSGCTSLTTAPDLPATTLADYCYTSMFKGCTALASAPALPATTLANGCYTSMFWGCTSLTSVPALPATTLADYCYSTMFYGCGSLKISSIPTGAYQYAWRIPTSGTGTAATATDWNSYMFSGTGGTFKSAPSINTTYYLENPPVSEPSPTDFPSDYYYVAYNDIGNETVDLTHIYFRTSIQASNADEFNIVTLVYCDHSTVNDFSKDYTDGTAQPDSNPFTAEGVNARILAQIKPATQFMTKYDPGNVAPDSIPKLQLMIEL